MPVNMPHGRDKEWLRAQLHALGEPIPREQPLPSLASTYSPALSPAEDGQAVLLLIQASEERRNGEVKTTANPAKIKHDKWTYEDYESVLKQLVCGPSSVPVGVLKSALYHFQTHQPKKARQGTLKMRKRFTDDENNSLMAHLISQALTDNRLDQLQALAHFAVPAVVSRAIPMALLTDNIKGVQVLMEEKADANTCPSLFLDCVAAGRLDFVRLLLQSQVAVSGSITTQALPAAVKLGDVEMVQLLLAHGANADFDNGVALRSSIDANYLTILISILLCNPHPASETLASMVSYVWSEPQLFAGRQIQLIEFLLNGGASGYSVDVVLSAAVKRHCGGLVKLLMSKGTSIACCDGQAYREAVYAIDYGMLEILNQGKLGKGLASDIFYSIDTTQQGEDISSQDWYKLAKYLLDQGAEGDVVHEALINRVQARDLNSVAMLLIFNASVDYKAGRALSMAVSSGDVNYIAPLLHRNPRVESVNEALSHVPNLSHNVQLDITLRLLEAGATGPAVDMALDTAVSLPIGQRDHVYIQALVDGGADAGQQDGLLFHKVVLDGDAEVLEILLGGNFPTAILVPCIPLAMKLDEQRRYEMLEILLDNGPKGGPVIDQALIDSIDETNDSAIRVTELLLKTGAASTAFKDGEAFITAIRCKNLVFLKLLLQFNSLDEHQHCACLLSAIGLPRDHVRLEKIQLLLTSCIDMSSESWTACLKSEMQCMRQDKETSRVFKLLLDSAKRQGTLDELLLKAVREPLCDYLLLKFLLQADASILYRDGECILHAVMKNDTRSLQLFQRYFRDHPTIIPGVFERAWTMGARAGSHEAALSFLLKRRAAGSCLNIALVDTIEAGEYSEKTLTFIANLLNAGADVDYNHGACLVKAAAKGNIDVLKAMFAHCPARESMTLAFPYIFASGVDSQTICALVMEFCSHQSRPSFTDSPQPILFLLLQKYPKETGLLKYLIDAGCPVDLPVVTHQGKYLSLLHWVLIEDEHGISDNVIEALLDGGANPNRKTAHGLTPLELAISRPRRQVVASLLRHKADATVATGSTGSRSMLFLAVTTGDSDIVRRVMLASLMEHDGALHEAAREVDTKIIEILVKEGKQRDYAYSGCNGRTALAELCLNADGNKPVHQLKRAMTLLKDGRCFRKKSNGKSALHLALDNPRGAPSMTRALLDSFMAEFINEEFNLYKEDGLVYSPFAYVKMGRNKASGIHDGPLLQLLSQFGCRNRFWARDGRPQPANVVNPPEEIAKIIRDQKKHERMLAQIRAQSDEAQSDISKRHGLILETEQSAADQRRMLEEEAEKRLMSTVARRHFEELAHLKELSQLSGTSHEISISYELKDAWAQYGELSRKRQQDEIKHLEEQQRIITAGFKTRAEIEKKNREANALEMRRLRELQYEIDAFDLIEGM
ncbi:hypothetical protein ASPZODRAFT_115544 [Penicilliopsis zonata CBS 506.65]|uniref:Uncharacterized protein n=1 Tax=Penicilliopsis zonata CBS 506.65 TaxID=1073090 RepID=A0A1L9SI38_9EURO|nr:hypothetical protein ASPZODRAFT_115544 [Penicilliopsis zonata CBS 506.65]OJJ46848.1 hypothetical protein ASPZODRAFT_115544 [Penicilliopsis zonata CBS 506.65]